MDNAEPLLIHLADENGCYQESAYDEENIDTNESSTKLVKPSVKENDRHDREGTQPINFWTVFQFGTTDLRGDRFMLNRINPPYGEDPRSLVR